MNTDYKKGFIEAIDGALKVLSNREKKFEEEKYEEDDLLPYELKKIENSVLGLKISFFENYYENSKKEEDVENELTPLQKKMERVDSFEMDRST